jgi:hypothetical protein
MKKFNNIVIGILSLIGFSCIAGISIVGCAEQPDRVVHKKGEPIVVNEYPKPFGIETTLPSNWEHGIILGSDNHEYLILNDNNNETVMHYIDCKLCKTRK